MPRRLLGIIFALSALTCLCLAGRSASQPTEPNTQRKPVQIKMLVPAANAEVRIDDTLTKQTGTTRSFVTPPLATDRDSWYFVTVTWAPNNYTTITRTRRVAMRGGKDIELDLRQADDKSPDKIVIRYVPTPNEVVEAMLKLGKVGKDDVVYDLGCGDGRIVVTAVQKYGAKRGVGVDIDPDRIRESRANAKAAGVADRVDIRQDDVLQLNDLPSATVVMLYMGTEMNLRLRPILEKALKPGSRIVSHRFMMGDWKPDKSETITDRFGQKYDVHLWTIGEKKP